MDRAVFLDRDNTLIANHDDLGDPQQVRLLDGVAEGLAKLAEAGWRLVVVTNQAGVARGTFTEADVDAVNRQIVALIEQQTGGQRCIERFYYCPYDPDGTVDEYRRDHAWRKPAPGMLLQAAQDLALDLSASWMVGDQCSDVQAGRAAGCRTLLVTRETVLAESAQPDALAVSFAQAVATILKESPVAMPVAAHAAGASSTLRASSRATERADEAAETVGDPSTRASDETEPRMRMTSSGLSTRQRGRPSMRTPPAARSVSDDSPSLHRAVTELTEELRSARQRSAEFTPLKMIAGFCQLLVILLAALGLLHLTSFETFLQWMAGALLIQLLTITLLILDLKG